MSLLTEVENILSNLAQEVEQEASVLVQFAAGDWARLKAAFLTEKSGVAPVIADTPLEHNEVSVPVVESTEAPVIPEPVVETAPVADAPAYFTPSLALKALETQPQGDGNVTTSDQPQ